MTAPHRTKATKPPRKPKGEKAGRLGHVQAEAIKLELQGVHRLEICERLSISKTRWYEWHKSPTYLAELLLARRAGAEAAALRFADAQMQIVRGTVEVLAHLQRLALGLVLDEKGEPLRDDDGQLVRVPIRDQIRACAEFMRGSDMALKQSGYKPLAIEAPTEEGPQEDPHTTGVAKMLAAIEVLAKAGAQGMQPQKATASAPPKPALVQAPKAAK